MNKYTTNKLWQTNKGKVHPLVEAFTVGDDYIFDQQLLPYDVKASIAHAEMLFEINVIDQEELIQAKTGLLKILEKWQKNEFIIEKNQEDGHTAIEQYLTKHYDTIGKKIHTGRSRNDQSLVMIRLFMKEKLLEKRLILLGSLLTSHPQSFILKNWLKKLKKSLKEIPLK